MMPVSHARELMRRVDGEHTPEAFSSFADAGRGNRPRGSLAVIPIRHPSALTRRSAAYDADDESLVDLQNRSPASEVDLDAVAVSYSVAGGREMEEQGDLMAFTRNHLVIEHQCA